MTLIFSSAHQIAPTNYSTKFDESRLMMHVQVVGETDVLRGDNGEYLVPNPAMSIPGNVEIAV